MCGIAGIIAPKAGNYRNELQKMTNAIAYRGPDAERHEFFPNAALGHRRLSILDLSETGSQPMFSDTGKECIVLNGEIYGFLDLKKKYADYPFRGTSDTEVILAMYRSKGPQLIHELPGMFAFAIWDDEKQELFCARDRFGEKPFFYAIGNQGEFIFASEIKAILRSGLIHPKVNDEAVYHFLKNGYVSTYQTIFSNVFSLPPAHSLTFSGGKISVKRYYKIPEKDSIISLGEAKEEFTFLLKTSLKKQLVADVEVGSFLSGGLDSSTIVALINQFSEKQTTVSFGYSGQNSELEFAEQIAHKYQTHHIEVLENRGDVAEELQKISPYFDEPFSDMSYFPHFKICEAAVRYLKVALSGDVGDELFGGYHFYTVEDQLSHHFSYKNILAKSALGLYGKFKAISYKSQQNVKYRDIIDFHQNSVRNYFSLDEIKTLGINVKYEQPLSFTPNPNSLNDIMRIDLEKYVPGNMLVKGDRMSMANSLEVRTPFLDQNFAEFCIQLPSQLKIKDGHDKIILRDAMASYWTDGIKKRPKQGFGSSVDDWLQNEKVKNLSNNLLRDRNSKVFEYINFETAQKFIDGGRKEWNLLQFALWANNYQEFL